jgi:hypothetical protein
MTINLLHRLQACQVKNSDPNPDIEKETVFPACHCEHPKGTCLHAEVTAFTDSLCYLGVTARRRGNLIEKDGIASFYSQ